MWRDVSFLRSGWSITAILIPLWLDGCSSSSTAENKIEPCSPGESVACQSASGCNGRKTCKSDGNGFGSCMCTDAGSGGSGGGSGSSNVDASSGGAGGVGGSSGSGGAGGTTGGASGAAGTTDAAAGNGGAGGSSGTSGTDAGSCAATGGPTAVQVPAPNGGAYCIDSTEVTNAQYAQFLAAKGSDLTGQPAVCYWNSTYEPSMDWPATGRDTYPVVYVDWCDAYAFCKWAGKRLCGKIGGTANAYADFASAAQSQWFNACSKGGTQAYPYGNAAQPGRCVDVSADGGGVTAGTRMVRTAPQCEGGYPGIFDISGNVWEWEDSCNGNQGMDPCRIRGGSYGNTPGDGACALDNASGRQGKSQNLGIRCCGG